MNFLAHAHRHLNNPLYACGCVVPDWLNAVDRKVRVRRKRVQQWLQDQHATDQSGDDTNNESGSPMVCVAQGIAQHHHDDHVFHGLRSFTELNLHLALRLRNRLGENAGLRPMFVGHIVIEML
ncbi:MAG: hypothetical protein AAFP90_11710, partial [Planctomycetota bacterium]